MDDEQKKMFKKLLTDSLVLGIGDVAAATGVSQSQLRYWERKGYIQSQAVSDGRNRKFTYKTLIQVQQIKFFLDDGYTLVGAVKQAKRRRDYFDKLQDFFTSRFEHLELADGAGEIDLGVFDPQPNQRLVADQVGDHWQFRLVPLE
ncbi:transcriptional regulator [Levilactobacillus brevis]|nr:MerR family transcriptional regulator [Levilactobacillus brevis]QCZ47873.1 transcriptional regulator [Levilactobacillus brevis]